MPLFLKVKTAEEVFEILREIKPLDIETLPLEKARGRSLAAPVFAPEPVPHFARATMDGYAVRARDTFGASESLPAFLETAESVSMGDHVSWRLEGGKAIAIPTGGMLPEGADAVVMVEYTIPLDDRTIEVTRPVAPGDNVLREGEDIPLGEELFRAGWPLRPQDMGVLAALGIKDVSVIRRPKVAVLSTGDEIVPVSTQSVPPGKIRDINTYSLAAQMEETGAEIGQTRWVQDDLGALIEACREALATHDVLVLSGGSSVGVRDFTVRILDAFPEAELLVHGVAIRPGKPTILARIGKKLFWGLPGQPVSAMMICKIFVLPSLLYLQGYCPDLPSTLQVENACRAVLNRQVPSVHGRTDYVPVVLSRGAEGIQATPVFGKSAMISILARSDGYIIIPEHVEGLDQGTEVTVHFFSCGRSV